MKPDSYSHGGGGRVNDSLQQGHKGFPSQEGVKNAEEGEFREVEDKKTSESGVEVKPEKAEGHGNEAQEEPSAEALRARVEAERSTFVDIKHKNRGLLEKTKAFLGLPDNGEELPDVKAARERYEKTREQLTEKLVQEAMAGGGTPEEIKARVAEALRVSQLEEGMKLADQEEAIAHGKWMGKIGGVLDKHEQLVGKLGWKGKVAYYGALIGGSIAFAPLGVAVVGTALANLSRKAYGAVEAVQAKKAETAKKNAEEQLRNDVGGLSLENADDRLAAISRARELMNAQLDAKLKGRQYKVGAAGLAIAGGLVSRSLTSVAVGAAAGMAAGGKNWKTGALLGGLTYLGGSYVVEGVQDAYESLTGGELVNSAKEALGGVVSAGGEMIGDVGKGIGDAAGSVRDSAFDALDEAAPLGKALAHDASGALDSFQQTDVYKQGAELAGSVQETFKPAVDAVTQSESWNELSNLAGKAGDKLSDVADNALDAVKNSSIFGETAMAADNVHEAGANHAAGTVLAANDGGVTLDHAAVAGGSETLDRVGTTGPGAADHLVAAPKPDALGADGMTMEVGRGGSVEKSIIDQLLKSNGEMTHAEAGRMAHRMVLDLSQETGVDWRELNKIKPGAHIEMVFDADGKPHLAHIDAFTTKSQEITMDSSRFHETVVKPPEVPPAGPAPADAPPAEVITTPNMDLAGDIQVDQSDFMGVDATGIFGQAGDGLRPIAPVGSVAVPVESTPAPVEAGEVVPVAAAEGSPEIGPITLDVNLGSNVEMPKPQDLLDNEKLTRFTAADLVSPDLTSASDQGNLFDQATIKPEEGPVFNSEQWKGFFDGLPYDTRLDITGQSKDIIQLAVRSDILGQGDLRGIQSENPLVKVAETILGPEGSVQKTGFMEAPESVPNYLNRIQTFAESTGQRDVLLAALENVAKGNADTAVV